MINDYLDNITYLENMEKKNRIYFSFMDGGTGYPFGSG